MPLVITVYTNNDINTWEHHIEFMVILIAIVNFTVTLY